MARKLITAQRPFTMLVANLTKGSDPSRGPSGNPVKLRQTFTTQNCPEVVGRGTEFQEDVGPQTRVGTLQWTVDGVPVRAEATITVTGNTFAGPTWVQVGVNRLVSGETWSAGTVDQATGSATVVATPSVATLTIGGVALTATAGARTPGNDDYNGTLGSPALIAADIVAAINDGANSFAAVVTAANGGAGLINLTAVPVGDLGNAVTLATSDVGDVTVSGAALSGGADAVDNTALELSNAIDAIPELSASAVGPVITISGLTGPTGNVMALDVGGTGAYNLTLEAFAGAEPFIGPPEIT